MSTFRKTLSFVTAFILTLATIVPLTVTPVMAQATTGNLTGTVKDQNGAAIAGAKVSAANQETGETTSPFTTTGEGNYRIPNLKPGHYTITVEATGFKKAVTTDFEVKVGTENTLDPILQAGAVTETVTVVAGGEEIAQQTSQQSTSFETRKVEELPSNAAGGGIDTLALLAPGVVPGFGNVNSNGTTLSVNGNRARSNNFTLDGTDNNDLTIGGPIKKNKPFFFVDGQLIRQRQTFLFQAGNPAILPSGLATLAAAFPGNPAIAAIVNQSVFALQPSARVQQSGAATTGNICFPRDPTLACSGANAVLVPTGFPEYLLPLPFDQKEYGLRGDFNPTNKDSFNVKYRYQQSPEVGSNSQSNGFFGDIPFKSRNLNGVYTRQINSRMVNEFKAAWQKLGVTFGGCTTTSNDLLKGCIPDTSLIDKAFTNITFTGIRASGVTLQSIGPATNVPQGRSVRVAQFSDNLSWTKGRHSMLIGVDYRNLDNSVPFLPNLNGAFRFSSTARIVANAPSFVTIVAGKPTITYKENDQFYFAQDDWKIRDNLTLNLGIRYEYTGQPINTLHNLTLARETDASTAIWRQSLPIDVRTVPKIPVDKNNWAPRVGFAWVPHFGNGDFAKTLFGENDATVIRGGYSIAYDPAFYNILLNVSTSTPNVFNNTINNNSSLTAPLFHMPANPTGDVVRAAFGSSLQKNTFDPRFFNETIVGKDFHAPYSQQWSVGVH